MWRKKEIENKWRERGDREKENNEIEKEGG